MQLFSITENYNFRLVNFREKHYNDARTGNNCHYIGYMRNGQGVLRGENDEIHVSPGDLFYIPLGFRYESFWKGTPDILFDSYGFDYLPCPIGASYSLQIVPINEEIQTCLNALAEHRAVDCHSIARLYLLLEAMLHVMRPIHSNAKARIVEQAVNIMQTKSIASVPALAKECHISESGLYAAFREINQCTPIEMWHRILAERAKTLLVSTDFSIEEIAARLGLCSTSYFRKILREVTGKTPREIRNSAKI